MMKSIRGALMVAPLAVVLWPAAVAAQTGHTPFDTAYHAWDRGEYVAALEGLRRILDGPEAAARHEAIALLTGELHHTHELTADGRLPGWSPDGRHVTFESGSGAARSIELWDASGAAPRRLARMSGWAPAFSSDGRLAYLRPVNAPELRAAVAEQARLATAGDVAALRRQAGVVARLETVHAEVVERDLRTGRETVRRTPALARSGLLYAQDGTLLLLGAPASAEAAGGTQVYALDTRGGANALTTAPGTRGGAEVLPGGRLLYTMDATRFAVLDLASGSERVIEGSSPSAARDGSAVVFVRRGGPETSLHLWRVGDPGDGVTVRASGTPMANPALSPSGRRIAFQTMLRDDWEIFLVAADGTGESRLTRDIQHDLMPQFLSEDRLLAVMGEGRHRRSFLYTLAPSGERGHVRQRLFHNNLVRTVSQEYLWVPNHDGTQLLVWADRDGDTVSPERGVYRVDLNRRVTREELIARVDAALAAERDLRARGTRMFAPIAPAVREMVADVEVGRIYEYAHDLYQFDSKFITQPGNRLAIDYLERTLRSWGYDVELEWFEPRPGVRTANVVATLPGTVQPELIYMAGSHFDSVERGPGADDNSSGTTALLEAARVMRNRPQPATLRFVFFTGEEGGLLGSREHARRALARGDRVLGALNNDMIGWTRSHRLDNTIRYSNPGLRDVQHAAAFLFTDLITYDSRYYQSTDAHALFDAFGNVISGIGSYPILGNPHYHQPHDILEVINHQLVAEVSKTTAATLMLMASSPSLVTGLDVTNRRGDAVELRWTASPERGVREYEVEWRRADGTRGGGLRVNATSARLMGVPADATLAVRAVGENGSHGWDWAVVPLRGGDGGGDGGDGGR